MGLSLRRVKTSSGATAVQIMVKECRRNKLVEHVGSAHNEQDLAALEAKARRRMVPEMQDVLPLDPVAARAGRPKVFSQRSLDRPEFGGEFIAVRRAVKGWSLNLPDAGPNAEECVSCQIRVPDSVDACLSIDGNTSGSSKARAITHARPSG